MFNSVVVEDERGCLNECESYFIVVFFFFIQFVWPDCVHKWHIVFVCENENKLQIRKAIQERKVKIKTQKIKYQFREGNFINTRNMQYQIEFYLFARETM